MKGTVLRQFAPAVLLWGLFFVCGCGEEETTSLLVTIHINVEPDDIGVRATEPVWRVEGPENVFYRGFGDTSITDLPSGNYVVEWSDVTGWQTPSRNPFTQTLVQGSNFTFFGRWNPLTVDVVIINVEPTDENNRPLWELVENEIPWFVEHRDTTVEGQGDVFLNFMPEGRYTIEWRLGEIREWGLPIPATISGTLEEGGSLEFVGRYKKLLPIDTVEIDPNPDFLKYQGGIGWELAGPEGLFVAGRGDTVMNNMDLGEYTLTWQSPLDPLYEVPQPNPNSQTLVSESAITFRGNFQKFIRVEPGTYTRGSPGVPGSPGGEVGRFDREGPQHEVTLTRAFFIGKTEVTQEEFMSAMGGPDANPSFFADCDSCPVESVHWIDTIRYCNERSLLEGFDQVYTIEFDSHNNPIVEWDRNANGYRLPTEAEWEYACRGGPLWTGDPFSNGASLTTMGPDTLGCDPVAAIDDIAWYCANADSTTRGEAKKSPNPLGLYDMHGNVWEWCWDWFGLYDPSGLPQEDPVGPSSGPARVVRGGSWKTQAWTCRSAMRGLGAVPPNGIKLTPEPHIGFRVVRNAE